MHVLSKLHSMNISFNYDSTILLLCKLKWFFVIFCFLILQFHSWLSKILFCLRRKCFPTGMSFRKASFKVLRVDSLAVWNEKKRCRKHF